MYTMIQEYLFDDKLKCDEIKKYKPSGIQVNISNIENTDCWIVSYSISGNDESAARKMSEVYEYVTEHFHPITLTDESASYFDKVLYPLINEFEHKLRKLLYIKSFLNKNDKTSNNINDLESKNLGQMFELLFTDEQFVKNVRIKVQKEMTWSFPKSALIEEIEKIPENTVWDQLMGSKAVPLLREEFSSVKKYRNDVMHAHSINYKTYKEAKSLFIKINKQLDAEIGLIVEISEKPTPKNPSSNYNLVLSEAIKNMNLGNQSIMLRESFFPAVTQLQEIYSRISDITSSCNSSLNDAIQGLNLGSQNIMLHEQLSPAITKLQETYSKISEITSGCNMALNGAVQGMNLGNQSIMLQDNLSPYIRQYSEMNSMLSEITLEQEKISSHLSEIAQVGQHSFLLNSLKETSAETSDTVKQFPADKMHCLSTELNASKSDINTKQGEEKDESDGSGKEKK